jgi:hypothetical protein
MRTLLLSSLLTALILSGAVPAAAQTSQEEDPALESLATCLRERGSLVVLLLIDESGSLQRTDPAAQRVIAAKVALTNLERLSAIEMGNRTPDIAVGLSAFATEYSAVTPFTRLDEVTSERLRADIDGFAGRDDGLDTDYATALEAARQDLDRGAADISSSTGTTPCRALALFSDGDYDIEARDTERRRAQGLTRPYALDLPLDEPGNAARVIERGKAAVCDDDGIRDRLVDADVVLLTVALTDDISEDDRRWLEAVSAGRAGADRCGSRATTDNGFYFGADDLPGLVAAFDRITQRLGGGAELPSDDAVRVCERTFCAEGTREFEVDETLSRFHLLGDLGADEVRLELRAPGSIEPVALPAEGSGTVRAGGAELHLDWLSPRAVTIDAVLPRGTTEWAGTWSITFIDPTGTSPDAPARSQIYLYGDALPQLTDVPDLRLGEQAELEVEIVDSLGAPLGWRGAAGSVDVTALMIDPTDGSEVAIPLSAADGGGPSLGSYQVPQDLEATFLSLRLRSVVTTAAGVRLAPFTTTYQLPVSPPIQFPKLTTTELQLTSVTGIGSAAGVLRVSGGEHPGCVWIEGIAFDRSPAEAGPLAPAFAPDATVADSCVPVPAGATREIDVTVGNSELGSGRVEGVLGVVLSADGEAETIRQEVPLSFDMARPVDPVVRAALFGALLLLCLLPIALMYVLNRFGAKFESAQELLVAQIRVRIRADDRVERLGDARHRGLTLTVEDFSNLGGPPGRSRRLSVGPLELRARVAKSPFKPPYGRAAAEACHVASARKLHRRGALVRAEVPLALAGTWVFLLDEPDPAAASGTEDEVHGTAVLILSYDEDTGFSAQAERLVERLETELPPAARAVAEEARLRGHEVPPDVLAEADTQDEGRGDETRPSRKSIPPPDEEAPLRRHPARPPAQGSDTPVSPMSPPTTKSSTGSTVSEPPLTPATPDY